MDKIRNWFTDSHYIGLHLPSDRLYFEMGWFPGEEQSGLLQIEFMRWVWYPRIKEISLCIIGITILKFSVYLQYQG